MVLVLFFQLQCIPNYDYLLFCSNYKLLNDCFVSTFEKECGLETRAVTVEFVKTVVAGNEVRLAHFS